MIVAVAYSISSANVHERDIDLLLLEELVTSLEFFQWFSSRMLGTSANGVKLLNAQHSVKRGNKGERGESDIEVLLQDRNGDKVYLLVENKINAILQERQAERYQRHGQQYRDNDNCKRFRVALVAPEYYLGNAEILEDFDEKITYEEIKDWFLFQPKTERRNFKVKLLTAAIDKGTYLCQSADIESVIAFRQQYWELVQTQAPALKMRKPGPQTKGSSSILFYPDSLPSGVILVHKLLCGNVDLEFRGRGQEIDLLEQEFRDFMKDDNEMTFERIGESGGVRLKVQPIQLAHDFSAQEDSCHRGIRAAVSLLNLYKKSEGIGAELMLQRTLMARVES